MIYIMISFRNNNKPVLPSHFTNEETEAQSHLSEVTQLENHGAVPIAIRLQNLAFSPHYQLLVTVASIKFP